MGQVWILANTPAKALKLPRHKAASLSVVDSCQHVIKPVAPLALRLQAMLLRGIVLLYNRQLVLLYDDASTAVARLQSQVELVAGEAGKLKDVTLPEPVAPSKKRPRRDDAHGAPPVDALDVLQVMEGADGGLSFMQSQGGDSFMFVDSQALRGLESGRAQHGGASRFGGAARDDITLPDADDFMHRETSMSRGVTHFTGAFFMPGDEEEEFAVLPDDMDMDALQQQQQGRRSGSAGGAPLRSPFSELQGNVGLPPLAEDDDFPPPPAADDDEADEPPAKKRKGAKRGILKKSAAKSGAPRTDEAIILNGDVLRAWLKDAASISCIRRKLGEAAPGEPLGGDLVPGAKGSSAALSARVDAALKQPSMLLLAGHRVATQPGRVYRGRALEATLLHLFARHTPGPGRRAAAASSDAQAAAPGGEEEEELDMPMPMADDDEPEAFRAGALPGRSPASSFGAPLFGRRSNVSAATGSASALAAALAGAKSPSSAHTAAGRQRLSDAAAFGGALSDDLPDVGAPFPEDDAAAHAGLSQRFGSALPETGDGTQPASAPGVGLSGVSAGVMAYLANALGPESQAAGTSLVFDAMARGNSLSKTQTAQLFAQMLILATAGLVGVSQEAPYEDIFIRRGAVALEAH